MADLQGMTPDELVVSLGQAGISTPEGKLTEHYANQGEAMGAKNEIPTSSFLLQPTPAGTLSPRRRRRAPLRRTIRRATLFDSHAGRPGPNVQTSGHPDVWTRD